jgi:glycosyltransferase involved in cell wall biosynthesis
VNIALVTQHFRRGGLETHLGGFARAIKAHGHRLSLVTGAGAQVEALRESLDDRLLQVAWPDSLSAGAALDVVERLADFCRAQHVELLHVHPFLSVALGALAAARLRIPYVLTLHGPSNLRADDHGGAFVLAQLLEGASRVHCVCRELSDSVRALAPACRPALLPNSVDLDRWPPATRDAGGPWAVVARLEDDKVGSVRCALQSLAELLGARFQARVFGDGSARPALERWLADQGWGDRVRLEGHRDDLATVLAEGFAGVAGMTRVVLEGGALGLPVLLAGYDGVKGLAPAAEMETLAACNFSGRGRPTLEGTAIAAQMALLDSAPERFQLRQWISAHASESQTWSRHLEELQQLPPARLEWVEAWRHRLEGNRGGALFDPTTAGPSSPGAQNTFRARLARLFHRARAVPPR